MQVNEGWKPTIVAFCCNWCSYAGADLSGTNRLTYPANVKMKFYKGSSKARGSGIGLAVCEEIVTMHGGVLTLENAEGGGTLVTISIPVGEE